MRALKQANFLRVTKQDVKQFWAFFVGRKTPASSGFHPRMRRKRNAYSNAKTLLWLKRIVLCSFIVFSSVSIFMACISLGPDDEPQGNGIPSSGFNRRLKRSISSYPEDERKVPNVENRAADFKTLNKKIKAWMKTMEQFDSSKEYDFEKNTKQLKDLWKMIKITNKLISDEVAKMPKQYGGGLYKIPEVSLPISQVVSLMCDSEPINNSEDPPSPYYGPEEEDCSSVPELNRPAPELNGFYPEQNERIHGTSTEENVWNKRNLQRDEIRKQTLLQYELENIAKEHEARMECFMIEKRCQELDLKIKRTQLYILKHKLFQKGLDIPMDL